MPISQLRVLSLLKESLASVRALADLRGQLDSVISQSIEGRLSPSDALASLQLFLLSNPSPSSELLRTELKHFKTNWKRNLRNAARAQRSRNGTNVPTAPDSIAPLELPERLASVRAGKAALLPEDILLLSDLGEL